MPSERRQSLRLSSADYTAPGPYFVTFCVQGHACALGEIVDGRVRLSREGEIVEKVWWDLPAHYPWIELGDHMIMPNHVHDVVWIMETTSGVGLDTGSPNRFTSTGAGLCSGSPDRIPIHRPAPTDGNGENTMSTHNSTGFNPVGAGLLNAEQAGPQTRRPAPGQDNTHLERGQSNKHPCGPSLPEIIRAWKSFSARRINLYRNTPGVPFWQRSFYDRLIRNQKALERITGYILANPTQWDTDRVNPENLASPSSKYQR